MPLRKEWAEAQPLHQTDVLLSRIDGTQGRPRSENALARPVKSPGDVITTDAMNELCTLMRLGELTSEVFDDWVSRYYAMPGDGGPGSLAEPRSIESARERVHAFDAFLLRREVVDSRFTRAIIALRNVFALHAGMSTPVTIVLGLAPVVPQAPVRLDRVRKPGLSDLIAQLFAVSAERAHG